MITEEIIQEQNREIIRQIYAQSSISALCVDDVANAIYDCSQDKSESTTASLKKILDKIGKSTFKGSSKKVDEELLSTYRLYRNGNLGLSDCAAKLIHIIKADTSPQSTCNSQLHNVTSHQYTLAPYRSGSNVHTICTPKGRLIDVRDKIDSCTDPKFLPSFGGSKNLSLLNYMRQPTTKEEWLDYYYEQDSTMNVVEQKDGSYIVIGTFGVKVLS